ncbi:chain-length determining protein [Rhizobium rosettiformans]|uniref:Chain-length determining protein n=1 Tax=Rhizobium rosettiformans TaxID=1368430 RepID=A0ABX7ERH4_9HYPH|nr:GumC family protein [Rhizobium rosettiformans]QRF50570.1 chain-length determining protein [Rhizobium rosettiformans]
MYLRDDRTSHGGKEPGAAGAERLSGHSADTRVGRPSLRDMLERHDDYLDFLRARVSMLEGQVNSMEVGESRPSAPSAVPKQQPSPEISTDNRQDENRDGTAVPRDQTEWKPLIDPFIVVDILKRSHRILIASTVIGGLFGSAYALTLPKMWVASSDILVDPRQIRTVGDQLTTDQLPTDASLAVVESQARIVKSNSVLLKVIEQADLKQDPEFNGTLKPSGLSTFWSSGSQSDAQSIESRVLNHLHEVIDVSRDQKTFIFSISAETRDPEKSARLANIVSGVFQRELASMQSDAVRRTSDELSSRLTDLRMKLEEAEKAAESFRNSNDLVNVDGRPIVDNDLKLLNERLSSLRVETAGLRAKITSIAKMAASSGGELALPEDVSSDTIAVLRTRYADLRKELESIAARYGPQHPRYIEAQSQASGMLNQIREELGRIRSALQVELDRSLQQEVALTSRLRELKDTQASNNDSLVTLRELEREAAARRSVYESFLLRTRETGEQEAITLANIQVLSEARPPLDPVGPSRKVIALGGLIAGFGFGVLLALGLNLTHLRKRREGAQA